MTARVDAHFPRLFDAAVPAGFLLLPLFLLSGCRGAWEPLPPVPGTHAAGEENPSATPQSSSPSSHLTQPVAAEPDDQETETDRERQERQARLRAAAAVAELKRREERDQGRQSAPSTRPLPAAPPAAPTPGPTDEELAEARRIQKNQPTYERADLFSTQHNIMTLKGQTGQTLERRYGRPDSIFTYPDPKQFYSLWQHAGRRPPETARFARVKQYRYEQGATRVFFYMERQDSGDWEIISVIREIPPGR
jgi:hypothetical protein